MIPLDPSWRRGLVKSSRPATEKTGAMGCEIESHQGMYKGVAFLNVTTTYVKGEAFLNVTTTYVDHAARAPSLII
jgi:hypothetical protein